MFWHRHQSTHTHTHSRLIQKHTAVHSGSTQLQTGQVARTVLDLCTIHIPCQQVLVVLHCYSHINYYYIESILKGLLHDHVDFIQLIPVGNIATLLELGWKAVSAAEAERWTVMMKAPMDQICRLMETSHLHSSSKQHYANTFNNNSQTVQYSIQWSHSQWSHSLVLH